MSCFVPDRFRRRPHLVFGTAAILLVPWIVLLAVTQPGRGVAQHLNAVRLVLVGAIVVLTLALIVRPKAAPWSNGMLGGAVAGFALAAVWFDVITRVGLPSLHIVTRLGRYAAVVGFAAAVLALRCLYRPQNRHLGLRVLTYLALLLLALEASSILTNSRPVLPVDHVGAAWVGLDVAECAGLATLALTLRAGRRFATFVGPATAALLFSDAAINVGTSGGLGSMLAGLGMAVVEIALGCLAVAVAVRRARQPAPPQDGLVLAA